jgi:integrase
VPKPDFPYRAAELYDAGGDLTKRWRVTFYVYNSETHQLVRKQKWISSKFKSKSQRLKEADRLIKAINKLLAEGYHISPNSPSKSIKSSPLMSWIDAFRWAASQKKSSVRYRSEAYFEFIIDNLQSYLVAHKMANFPLQLVTREHVQDFLNSLFKREVGNSTKNMYVKFVKILFNALVQAEKIAKSPGQSFKPFSVDQATQQAYGAELRTALLAKYQAECPEILPIVQWIFYTFIRPGELLKLRVRNIQANTIFIPGQYSKNKKSEHVLISPALEKFIQKHNIRSCPEHYFLIGYDGLPGPKAPCMHYFSNRHSRVRDLLFLPQDYTLYCWKHTGVTETYLATRDMDFVSRQCRHSSLDMTKRYLRGLGLLLEYPHRDQLPELSL